MLVTLATEIVLQIVLLSSISYTVEDAYPDTFDLNKLPFHHKVGDSIIQIINLYHCAFMEKYSGKCV